MSIVKQDTANSQSADRGDYGAFSLVELLLTLFILALLTGIVMVTAANAKRRAGAFKCQSNLRQIGVVMRSFSETEGGRLPSLDDHLIDVDSGRFRLPQDLGVSPTLFICPSDTRASTMNGSYTWNQGVSGRIWYKIPESTVILFDSELWHRSRNGLYPDGHVESLKRGHLNPR